MSAEQLLTDLQGCFNQLKTSAKHIDDSNEHLVSFCERLEAIFCCGMKQPGSLFGFNKREYWEWIEQLPNYVYNERQNPAFLQTTASIQASPKLRTALGRGRCFLRVALVRKILSVPVEHLLKNTKLTNYWYSKNSVIGNAKLSPKFMDTLFEITAVDFDLQYKNASFLDETWILPVVLTLELTHIEDFGMVVGYEGNRCVVMSVAPKSLAHKVHIEAGDCVDEVNGEYVQSSGVRNLLQKSKTVTTLTIIKAKLPGGSPFAPLSKRMSALETRPGGEAVHRQGVRRLSSPTESDGAAQLTLDDERVYEVAFLGKTIVSEACGDAMISTAIQDTLSGSRKPEDVKLIITDAAVEVKLSDSKNKTIAKYDYPDVSDCSCSQKARTCFGLIARKLKSSGVEHECLVFEAPSADMAKMASIQIAQGINRTVWFVDSVEDNKSME